MATGNGSFTNRNGLMVSVLAILVVAGVGHAAWAGEAKRLPEWDKTVEAAKKEGKVVIAIPPSNELRKELETLLKQKFGIEAELVAAPGPSPSASAASRSVRLSTPVCR
jgi:uncharacterized protein HemX